jgi:glycerophosphoryl diester phosphodiesterase
MGPETVLKLIKNDWESWPLSLGRFAGWNQSWALPVVQAHRGWHQDGILENSIEALAAAKSSGYQIAEIDVQITKDGIPVVFHDFNLRQQFSINVNISEMNYADLVQLGAFPKLQDVLTTKDRPPFLNIEIKSKNLLKFPVEDAVVEWIQKTQQAESVLISCFNPWALMRIKFLDKNLTRALLVTDQSERWNFYYLKKMWTLPLVEPHVLNIRHSMFSTELHAKLKNFNVLTAAWTVNDLELAKKLISDGVNSIISDTILPKSLT